MRIPRAYIESTLAVGSDLELPEGTHNHLVKVLRMREGQQMVLFNGDGFDYMATLSSVEKRRSSVNIVSAETNTRESTLRIEIGQGLSRGERMDFAIQKATELGRDHCLHRRLQRQRIVW